MAVGLQSELNVNGAISAGLSWSFDEWSSTEGNRANGPHVGSALLDWASFRRLGGATHVDTLGAPA